jgi:hypothetical protein
MVIDNLSPIGEPVPENESQARVLARLPKERQREIWSKFLQSGHDLSARNIKKFIDVEKNKGGARKQKDLSALISVDYKKKVLEMLDQIDLAKNGNWQKTSRQAALLWNRVMKEKIMSKT